MMMRKLANLVLTATLVTGMFGVATADEHSAAKPNYKMFPAAWYYPWVTPSWGENFQDTGAPDKGVVWQKDFEGEIVYLDWQRMQIKADGSGDIMDFYLYPGTTKWYPSWAGAREGSKVKVHSDDRHRVRAVHVVPFYKWLAGQTK